MGTIMNSINSQLLRPGTDLLLAGLGSLLLALLIGAGWA